MSLITIAALPEQAKKTEREPAYPDSTWKMMLDERYID